MGATLSYEHWEDSIATQLNEQFHESLDVLKWAYNTYEKSDIVYACSFGAEGIVLIDLISKVAKDATIVFLDTGLHFDETYQLIKQVKESYPTLNIQLKQPKLSVEEQEAQYGAALLEKDPNQCCHIRKVEPMHAVLTDVRAWISGLRREQSQSRRNTNYINKDDTFQAIKVCPLIHWTWKEIWQYILLHKLDYNILHDKGYPSIGCEKCTLPVSDESNSRSGRWAQFQKTECGLHSSS